MAAAQNEPASAARGRLTHGLDRLRHHSTATLGDRFHRVRVNIVLALQAGLAAGLAWLVAGTLIGHAQPFFAPISAVITLAASVGQRLRRALELVIGVAVGIAIGDALILVIGSGPWQITLVVTLAIIVAVFLGTGSGLVTQSANSAVLVATFAPPSGGVYYERFLDALVGGLVGMGVMALLLPLNPLTVVRRAANPALDLLSHGLTETAEAVEGRDPDRAREALDRMRDAERRLAAFQDAIQAANETATLAPARWRARGTLSQYVESAEYLGRALRNTRVLTRRVISMLDDGEPVPEQLPAGLRLLAEAVTLLRRELTEGVSPEGARERALAGVRQAGAAYGAGMRFNSSVVVAQLRATASDLVRATGADPDEVDRLVSAAFGRAGESNP
ncbi:FUSC family protein [Micromonospora sp. NPDC049679]|uniref:FUSC family protein n=1 Tax=Micromonospora sp. NPDC049679 TaxID=3155920 RepID=UPI0033DE8E50